MTLSPQQLEFYREQGYLVVDNVVDGQQLEALARQFQQWVDESRDHDTAYGQTLDDRARFDLEPGHSAETPALRRVSSPTELSDIYDKVMRDSGVTDCVAELIGPNVRFHHSKINSKLPGTATEVKWHQDFPFTPHSNDDLVTALLMIDDITETNGPLQVVPGSHRQQLHDLWQDGVFTGAVDDAVASDCRQRAITCTGKAGSVCLMHTRLLHGSRVNRSRSPRTLFIMVFASEDAVPCAPNPLPSCHQGDVVRGRHTGLIRSTEFELSLPQLPTGASFFDQQAKQ